MQDAMQIDTHTHQELPPPDLPQPDQEMNEVAPEQPDEPKAKIDQIGELQTALNKHVHQFITASVQVYNQATA